MARQRRLLNDIDRLDHAEPSLSVPNAQDRARLVAAERSALIAATTLLEREDYTAAEVLLAPFAAHATEARTLTSLARIYAEGGRVDAAIDVLLRAEAVGASFDRKVWQLLARMLAAKGAHREEVVYRRRLCFFFPDAPAHAFADLLKALVRSSLAQKEPSPGEVHRIVSGFKAAPDQDEAQTVRMAEALYGLRRHRKEARALYTSVLPCPTTHVDTTAEWVRLAAWCQHDGRELHRLQEGGTAGHRPSVAKLRDISIFPAWHWIPVVSQGRAAIRSLYAGRRALHSNAGESPALMDSTDAAELRLPKSFEECTEEALLIGGSQSHYAQVVEHIGSLVVAEAVGVSADLPLVVNDDMTPDQLELFKVLGIADRRRIPVTAARPVHFRHLHVPTRPALAHERIDPLLGQWCRDRFRLSGLDTSSGPRRLYLSRQNEPFRQVENETAVVDLLSRYGFKSVSLGAAKVSDQIRLIAGADVIVSATASALTNMVFANTGQRVIELQGNRWLSIGGQMHFDKLAESCGHHYIKVLCHMANLVGNELESDLTVDLAILAAALESLPEAANYTDVAPSVKAAKDSEPQ
jgi:capsular polysaccharide biosynthesis protein